MEVNKLISQLEQMKGNTFMHAKQVHSVLDFKIDENEEKFVLITNINQYHRKFESAEEFLKYWSPVTDTPTTLVTDTSTLVTNATSLTKKKNDTVADYIEQEKSQADDLIDILKDNIQKVQTNPDYIPQAKTINNNVNSIINIQKMKLDYYKQTKKAS